jgi:prepilin-type N-terminal cleavage/methylation domain-containing protein
VAPCRSIPAAGPRHGFSLIEALIASAVLATVVLAVAAGMGASQGVAFDGQKRMLASIAANDLLSELSTVDYADLLNHHGLSQPVGELETLEGAPYPDTFWALGREVEVVHTTMTDGDLSAPVVGAMVTVRVVDSSAVLAEVGLFVAEPY